MVECSLARETGERRMAFSGMLRHVALMVFTRATWCNIPEDAILHSHRRENLKSYKRGNLKKRTCSIATLCMNLTCSS
jgi:hypothetical protein